MVQPDGIKKKRKLFRGSTVSSLGLLAALPLHLSVLWFQNVGLNSLATTSQIDQSCSEKGTHPTHTRKTSPSVRKETPRMHERIRTFSSEHFIIGSDTDRVGFPCV